MFKIVYFWQFYTFFNIFWSICIEILKILSKLFAVIYISIYICTEIQLMKFNRGLRKPKKE